jgi:hypothetical protein
MQLKHILAPIEMYAYVIVHEDLFLYVYIYEYMYVHVYVQIYENM